MKKPLVFATAAAVIIVAAVILWPTFRPVPPPPPLPEAPAVPQAPAAPAIRHPIAESPPPAGVSAPGLALDRPLPALEESDERIWEILARLLPDWALERFLIQDHFIRRFVFLVDNLPAPTLPPAHLPTRPVLGAFAVAEEGGSLTIDPANYKRYTPFIRLAEAVEPEQAVAVYGRFYPLFQQAYEELGHPSGYFNDRLIEVIDHLLAAPEVAGPIRLTRPKVYYQFADPELEALSAGRKLLLRIGPQNAARVKGLLRAYRQELAGRTAGSE